MPFDRGSVTFSVFHLPQELPDDALARLQRQSAGPLERIKDEPEWGWVGNPHLLETRIDEQTAYSGGRLHLGLRQAQRKIPAALLQAECRMQELLRMAEDKLEFLNARAKKEIKQDVIDRLLPEMPPQLTGIPFVVDQSEQRLYCGAVSQKQLDQFSLCFSDTFGFTPVQITPEEAVAMQFGITAESLPRLNFSPEQPDHMVGGTIGQDFLTWLWYFTSTNHGALPKTRLGEFFCMVDGPLLMVDESENDRGARETSIRKGLPTQSMEAQTALRTGKKLRQARILCGLGQAGAVAAGQPADIGWEVTLDADQFGFRSLKLPEGEAMDADSVFEERLGYVQTFLELTFGLFGRFIAEIRDDDKFMRLQQEVQSWVKKWPGSKAGDGASAEDEG